MSKSKAKAKRSPARKPAGKRRRVPRDAAGHPLLFDPRTGEATDPVPRPMHRATPEEIAARRARARARMAEADARRAAFKARLARRPAEMQRDGYVLPADVAAFLRRLHREPWFYADVEHVSVAEAVELIAAAYMDGCRQGYIEGFVVRREPDRQRSRAGNAAKRKAVVTVGTRKMTRDERDAAMAAEYAALLKMMKPTPACQRLAGKYEYESWQGVAAAIKRFRERAGQ